MNKTDNTPFLPEELRDASACRLVVTFYDQTIAALEDAIDAIDAGDVERRYNDIEVATGLIAELATALDQEAGGQIAYNLGQLYTFILGLLPKVNLRNDKVAALQALRLLEPLRESWIQLDAQISAGTLPGLSDGPAFTGSGDDAGAAFTTAQ